MINKTEEMRDARHELQTLSASDPLARANMLRHVAACTQLLMGRPGVDALPAEPFVGAGFRLLHDEEKLFAIFTQTLCIERLYIAFDIDDAQGPPIETSLFRKEGDRVTCYGQCKLWSPANDGRALLVAVDPNGVEGHFAFRKGRSFRWVAGNVPGDLQAGLRRAQARLARLINSADAEAETASGLGFVITNVGQSVTVRPFPRAA